MKEKVSNPMVQIEEIEAHINQPVFAERATALFFSRNGLGILDGYHEPKDQASFSDEFGDVAGC